VAEVVAAFPSCNTAIVYGVEIPKREGRIGMAAIGLSHSSGDLDEKVESITEKSIDWKGLGKHVCQHLPTYARPYFVRIISNSSGHTTGTFKFVKTELRKEGFDISTISDPIYFLNNEEYVRMDKQLYQSIIKGTIKL